MPKIETAGRHACKVTAINFGESGKGTPYLFLDFKRTDDGYTKEGYLYLSEKAFPGTVQCLREVFGFDGNFEAIGPQLVGKDCSILTDFELNDQGKEQLRVKFINRPGVSKPIENQSALLKQLTQQAKNVPNRVPGSAKPVASASRATPAPKASTPRATAAVDDSDPFGTP